MKKIIVLMTLILSFSLLIKGFAEEAVPPKEVAPLITSETVGEPVPPPTLNDIKKVIRSERMAVIKEIKKQNNEILEKKNEEIKKMNREFLEKSSGAAVAIQQQADKINSKIGESSESLNKSLNRFQTFGLAAIILLVALILGIIIQIWRKKVEPIETAETGPTSQDLLNAIQKVENKIDNVPEEINKKIKELDKTPVDFEILGWKIIYKPPIDNNGYLSLYVPDTEAEKIIESSEITRLHIDHRGKLYNSTRRVMKLYLEGKFNNQSNSYSVNQKAVIESAKKNGQLEIKKIS